jgi:Uma2 family endonuclease
VFSLQGEDAMVVLSRQPHRMTVGEFLEWPEDPFGQQHQLIDGELVAMAPASDPHGSILMEIGGLIRDHLRARRSSCRVSATPGVLPRVRSEDNVRIPDIGVTCTPTNPSQRLMPDPVLLVEILSPSNEAETWANVWAYTTIPSVREILVVNSIKIAAELLARQADGSWPERPETIGPEGLVRLGSIDATFTLRDFYATTHLALR